MKKETLSDWFVCKCNCCERKTRKVKKSINNILDEITIKKKNYIVSYPNLWACYNEIENFIRKEIGEKLT